jgi:S-DNA-T family DNA segregation ATPase FtsK/SpoIIIE
MLFMTASTAKPTRIQGIFVSTKEVERIINAVKVAGGGMLTEEISLGQSSEDGEDGARPQIDLDADDNGGDDLFFEAVRVVQQTGKASASLLQRQMKVGYARAARLLDIMEEKGLIGPSDGAKARRVFMSEMAEESSDMSDEDEKEAEGL